MFKIFFKFIGDILLIPVVFAAIALFSQSMITSEQVACELQEDQLYTCNAQDSIFGMRISGVTAENVYDIDYDLKCSKGSKARGCTAFAAFQIDGGEPILLSKRYKDPDQVQKLTNELKSLMAEKKPLIEMSFPPSIFSMIVVGVIALIFFVIVLARAIENFITQLF
ncbi:MAG: hypothetical protein ACKOBD_11975 [Chloroflexota bacterium]